MKYRFMFFIMLVLSVQIGHAQEEAPPFPPENPESLFGDSVEIVDMHLESTTMQQANPAIVSREYSAVITHDGHIFPFPRQLASIIEGTEPAPYFHANNYIYFQISDAAPRGGKVPYTRTTSPEAQQTDERVTQYWMLDLTTGTYTRLQELPEYVETNCG